MKAIYEEFESFDKALTNTLIGKFSSMNLTSNKGVRKYIMQMRDITVQLKTLQI